jgi:hypothetical protein
MLIFDGIPARTLFAFSGAQENLGRSRATQTTRADVYGKLPPVMRERLCEYQLDGIEFVVSRGGKALIADEMGLGIKCNVLYHLLACLPACSAIHHCIFLSHLQNQHES